ncbi:MAG TPA: hypothetical protein VFG33_18110 [Kribbella sp.]|uniref:hypothetical protein n=1 Tax=Kribbella sp. TaxID=1871183 RepID=UPI002D7808FC|nr:hypothetical protein [Kribbella sp.]HET6295305.1 hypothetical protein [Kribbella sp.]
MKRSRNSAIAASALALSALGLTAPDAAARVPDEGQEPTTVAPHDRPFTEYNYPNYDPKYEVPRVETASVGVTSDDNGVEVLQAGASAIGGAALAVGAMWLYRRRHVPAT